MLILVVAACPGPPGNISPHRGSHQWKLSVVATIERIQLDMGWPPYHPPIHASHLPNAVGPDLEPLERNIHSRAQSWNMLKEKRAQNTAQPQVLHSTFLTLIELIFHVAQ